MECQDCKKLRKTNNTLRNRITRMNTEIEELCNELAKYEEIPDYVRSTLTNMCPVCNKEFNIFVKPDGSKLYKCFNCNTTKREKNG